MRISDWSSDVCSSDLFEPQFGLCGQPLVHLFEAVVNDGPSLIRTRKPVGASTVRFDALCMHPDVRFLFQRLQLVMDLMTSGWPSRTYPGIPRAAVENGTEKPWMGCIGGVGGVPLPRGPGRSGGGEPP